MSNTILIVVMFFVLLLLGTVANSLGVTSTVFHGVCTTAEQREIDPECFELQAPSDNPALPNFLDNIINIAKWAMNGIGAILQILTFQTEMPPLVNLLFFTPIMVGVTYIIVRVVRGS